MKKRIKKYLTLFPENKLVLVKIDGLIDQFCKTYILVKSFVDAAIDKISKIVDTAITVCISAFSNTLHPSLLICIFIPIRSTLPVRTRQ